MTLKKNSGIERKETGRRSQPRRVILSTKGKPPKKQRAKKSNPNKARPVASTMKAMTTQHLLSSVALCKEFNNLLGRAVLKKN